MIDRRSTLSAIQHAILVRSGLKSRLATMYCLIDYANREGLQELTGSIVIANTSILDICGKIAVNIENDLDPSVRKLTFNLRGR